jgi:CubicO group peptidase (beta-lactamase class C family)
MGLGHRALVTTGVTFLLAAGLYSPPIGAAQPAQTSASRGDVDRIFAPWDTRDSPGCALALYKNGSILYEHGYGMADLEHDVAIAPDTVFYVGSVSKQFTAFAAALAIQQGRIRPDDSIRTYLPELPDYAGAITVRQLVHHTSGLRDFYTLLSIAGRRQDDLFDNAAVLRLAVRQKGLNFPPGDDSLYSNTGYALLATIVGRVAGTTFGTFVDTNIFNPLGMTASHVHDDDARLVRGRAYGYARAAGGGLRLDTPAGERVGAGGVFTTVRDLVKWDENFYTGRVGGRTLIEQAETPGRLNDGRALTYAWGLEIGRYRGQPIVEHGGSLGGYRAHLLRFPDRHFSVACLCNLGSIAPGTLARQVADVMLADAFSEPAPAAGQRGAGPGRGGSPAGNTPAPLAAAALADYAGTYDSDEIGATFTVTVKDGQLMVQRDTDAAPAVLQPSSADQFRFGGMTVRFARGATRTIEALLVDAGRVRDIRFARRGR